MKKIIIIASIFVAQDLGAQSIGEGQRHLYYGRYESATQTFHKVLQVDPSNAEAWYGLVLAYENLDQPQQAADSLSKSPASVQDQPYFEVAKGLTLFKNGNAAEARHYLDQALKQTREKDANILGAVAQAYILAGQPNLAIDLLNKAIKRDKRNPRWNLLLGDAYLKMNNGSAAYEAYQDAVNKDDHYAAAHYQLGNIFLSQRNPELYLKEFQAAITADSGYAPALYQLYVYEFNRDAQKALNYYQLFQEHSDPSPQNRYDLADLYYLNKEYRVATQIGQQILSEEREGAPPRFYKLIAYSQAGLNDTAAALQNMTAYFEHQPDSDEVSRDYVTMAAFYQSMPDQDSLAVEFLTKAVNVEKDSSILIPLYKELAEVSADRKDFANQAVWLGKYYDANDKANNTDLFNWGLAAYRAGDYVLADTVFSRYSQKYPEQSFGFYWMAKSKALQDQEMKLGLAVPAYQQLIDNLQAHPQDPNYKKWIIESYSYLAAYETNAKKDYAEAVDYFEKVLTVDPENVEAKKYIDVLEKAIADKTNG